MVNTGIDRSIVIESSRIGLVQQSPWVNSLYHGKKKDLLGLSGRKLSTGSLGLSSGSGSSATRYTSSVSNTDSSM